VRLSRIEDARDDRRLREPIVMIMLVLVQILLGALTVWTGKESRLRRPRRDGALLFGTCVFTAAVRSYYALRRRGAVARSVAPRSVARALPRTSSVSQADST